MSWKYIGRSIICFLVVACLLVNISPFRAQAAAGTVAVAATAVVGCILIGLGVMCSDDPAPFNTLVNNCVDALEGFGHVVDGAIQVSFIGTVKAGFAVRQSIVDFIRNWIFSSDVVSVSSVTKTSGFSVASLEKSTYACGCLLECLYEDNPEKCISVLQETLRSGDYFVSGVSNVLDGSFYLSGYGSINGRFARLAFENPMGSTHSSCLGVYLAGSLNCVAGAYAYYKQYVNGAYVYTPVFFSSSAARSYYGEDWITSEYVVVDPSSLYQITERSYGYFHFSEYYSKAATDSVEVYKPLSIKIGFSQVDYFLEGNSFTGSSLWPIWYGAVPGYVEWDSVVVDSVVVSDGLTAGQIGKQEDEFAVAYPTWSAGAITVPGVSTGEEEEKALPLPGVSSLDDVLGLTQENVWSGSITDTDTDVGTGTESGTIAGTVGATKVETFISSLVDALVTPLVNGIRAIFVPSEDFLTAKVEALCVEFAFADAIVGTGEAIRLGLAGITTEPPVIYIDLGAFRGSYELGGRVAFIDMNWYSEYKPTVDALISAFLWICFCWRMLIHLPGILSGASGIFTLAPMPSTQTSPIGFADTGELKWRENSDGSFTPYGSYSALLKQYHEDWHDNEHWFKQFGRNPSYKVLQQLYTDYPDD